MSLSELVKFALESLQEAFLPGELAYLALTQKVEHAFRDSLAFKLHNSLDRDGFLVCREWNRTDLAVVQGTTPRLLLEAKALYTFDILKQGSLHPYPELLRNDYEKAALWQTPGEDASPEVLLLLIATHPHSLPSLEYRQAVKYYGGVANYAATAKTLDQTLMDVNAEVVRRVPYAVISHGTLCGGDSFGITVSVVYWLFAPPQRSDQISKYSI